MSEYSICVDNLKYYYSNHNSMKQAIYEQVKNNLEGGGNTYLMIYSSLVIDIDKNEIVKCRAPLTDIINARKLLV